MADGRMLKKRLSKSQKLAALPSDSPRLLYYMIYPHIDVEGRYEADPVIIKGQCVPYIKTFTEENIQLYLEQLHTVGLIILWKMGEYQYLEVTRFHDHNKINREREAKSLIPNPPKELRKLQSLSGVGQEFIGQKSSQFKSSLNISQELDCKTDLYKILKDLPLKETNSLITLFCSGLKTRGRCYEPKKCHESLRDIVEKTIKAKPDNYYGYLKVSIEKFHRGEGYKAK